MHLVFARGFEAGDLREAEVRAQRRVECGEKDYVVARSIVPICDAFGAAAVRSVVGHCQGEAFYGVVENLGCQFGFLVRDSECARAYASIANLVPVVDILVPAGFFLVDLHGRFQAQFDDGRAERGALFLAPLVIQPVIAHCESVGHFRRVEEVRGVPILKLGRCFEFGPQPLLKPRVPVDAVDQAKGTHAFLDAAADAEQASSIRNFVVGGRLAQEFEGVVLEVLDPLAEEFVFLDIFFQLAEGFLGDHNARVFGIERFEHLLGRGCFEPGFRGQGRQGEQ